MVMPYVGGETLADRLGREERLDAQEVRRILIEIADALASPTARECSTATSSRRTSCSSAPAPWATTCPRASA